MTFTAMMAAAPEALFRRVPDYIWRWLDRLRRWPERPARATGDATPLSAGQPSPLPEPTPVVEPAPEPPARIVVLKEPAEPPIASEEREETDEEFERRVPHASFTGQFQFKRDLLDKLDRYMHFFGRMKRYDPEAYKLFKSVGMPFAPDNWVIWHADLDPEEPDEVSAWFKNVRPTYGGFALHLEPDDLKHDKIAPRIFYFEKYKHTHAPKTVQPTSAGDVYVASIYFDDGQNDRKHGGVPIQCAVVVDAEGKVAALKIRHEQTIHAPVIKNRSSSREGFGPHKRAMSRQTSIPITRHSWGWPAGFTDWAKEHNSTPEKWIRWAFSLCAYLHETAAMNMINITAEKGGVVGCFAIDVRRSAYFFKDREKTGKRIFHAVVAHERIRNNKVSNVRFHFRGLRHFMWNGYQIAITIPGRHTADFAALNVPFEDYSEEEALPEGYDDAWKIGRKIKRARDNPETRLH